MEYEFDGLGRRIRKTIDPDDTAVDYDYYYNASWQVLEVRKNDDEDPLKRYVWSVRYIDEPVVRFYDGDTDGSLSGGSDNTLYYCVDANQNVTALAKAWVLGVQEVERYAYDPYGRVHVFDGNWSARTTDVYDNDILYCGYLLDRELGGLDGSTGELYGLYHVRHRNYHPALGRWLQREPGPGRAMRSAASDAGGSASGDRVLVRNPMAQYRDGMNLHAYVGCEPIGGQDPSGLSRSDFWKKFWGGNVKKAVGINLNILAQFKLPIVPEPGPEEQAGAGVVFMFFADTCELATFALTAGVITDAAEGKDRKGGEKYEAGLQVGASATYEVATMSGPAPASASSFEGVFHTPHASFKMWAGAAYAGDNIGGRRWFGGAGGVTQGLPAGGGVIDWTYKLDWGPYDIDEELGWVGNCACLAMVDQLLPTWLPDLP